MLKNNNKLQNKITTLIIIVATVFILSANTETNLEKIYVQEDDQISLSCRNSI
jgi:hypothetical protein